MDENNDDPSNKRIKIDDQIDPNQPSEGVIKIDEVSIQELTQKIQQLGMRIQQKQQNLAETREKMEQATILTKNLGTITQEFDQFVGMLLDQAESVSQNAENMQRIEDAQSNTNELVNLITEPETQLLVAAKSGNLELVKQLVEESKIQEGSSSATSPQLQHQSALFAAFQNGNNQIVEYLLEIVGTACNQLNLQEFCHFYSQLRNEELIRKCRKCLKTVIDAMEQAENAPK